MTFFFCRFEVGQAVACFGWAGNKKHVFIGSFIEYLAASDEARVWWAEAEDDAKPGGRYELQEVPKGKQRVSYITTVDMQYILCDLPQLEPDHDKGVISGILGKRYWKSLLELAESTPFTLDDNA